MKIFYAVQATGNGHISRAMELMPYLQKHGIVDVFLSGNNSHLDPNLPIKYRSKGISLYYNCKGGLSYWKMLKDFHPFRIRQEIKDLPVEKYDLVLNDFDYITSAACAAKKVPSIHFGHQASFQSPAVPRPAAISQTGEWLLKNYVKATHHVGIHFKRYDEFIFPAIVKKDILLASPADKNYITVYLPSYCEKQLTVILQNLPGYRFEVFSREATTERREQNILFIPIQKDRFTQSLINCTGIISGGGFETPAEALHLGKRIISLPIRGQYEQQCNAAALAGTGALCLDKIDAAFPDQFQQWVNGPAPTAYNYAGAAEACLEYILSLDLRLRKAA